MNDTTTAPIFMDRSDPDFLQKYEIGLNSMWADGRLRMNVKGFHMVWDDYQLGVVDPGPLVQPSYSIADFKVGIDAKNWDVNLFVNNFGDERAALYRVPPAPPGIATVNRPREYGISFTRRWDDQTRLSS